MSSDPAAPPSTIDVPRDTASARRAEPPAGADRSGDPAAPPLPTRYRTIRQLTEELTEPLEPEDMVVQSQVNVSPTKWHLAHVSWFFETFVLEPHLRGYEPLVEEYAYLFSSYYVRAGERHCRDQRGYISRPTVSEVFEYRAYVDRHMERLLETLEAFDDETRREIVSVIEIGLNHEQQHQELLLTDIKHVLSVNPLRPAYLEAAARSDGEAPELAWVRFEEGVREIGHDGRGFSYDNERPRHREFLEAFELANRPVTNGEYLAFMEDGGYERPGLWLSDGWATVQERDWTEPFYWEKRDGRWTLYTLGGLREMREAEPVCHLTYYEADAFARWADARLPTEAEWETAATGLPIEGNLVESGELHPRPSGAGGPGEAAVAPEGSPEHRDLPLHQMYGDVWEWTRSQYEPYPGFEPLPGALGEYNGKFMCNQFVLRGGSCATSVTHVRPTYRNFFHPDEAWQFSGLRLARDA